VPIGPDADTAAGQLRVGGGAAVDLGYRVALVLQREGVRVAQRHRDVITLIATALVVHWIHDHNRVHECHEGNSRSRT
jgi:hypothetical protein